jgi:hypothetical protein
MCPYKYFRTRKNICIAYIIVFPDAFNVILLSGDERTSPSYINLTHDVHAHDSHVLAHLQIPKLICVATFEIKFDCFANPGLTLEVVNNKN